MVLSLRASPVFMAEAITMKDLEARLDAILVIMNRREERLMAAMEQGDEKLTLMEQTLHRLTLILENQQPPLQAHSKVLQWSEVHCNAPQDTQHVPPENPMCIEKSRGMEDEVVEEADVEEVTEKTEEVQKGRVTVDAGRAEIKRVVGNPTDERTRVVDDSFIQPTLARFLQLAVQRSNPFKVLVANGSALHVEGLIEDLTNHMLRRRIGIG